MKTTLPFHLPRSFFFCARSVFYGVCSQARSELLLGTAVAVVSRCWPGSLLTGLAVRLLQGSTQVAPCSLQAQPAPTPWDVDPSANEGAKTGEGGTTQYVRMYSTARIQ